MLMKNSIFNILTLQNPLPFTIKMNLFIFL